ncbi:MAG: glycosyltransferase [Ignavibacteriaceae bacterium]
MSNSSISSIDQLIKLGELEKAESECLDLLDENENNAAAFSKLGKIYLLKGKEFEAQIFFEKALKIDSNYLPAQEKLNSLSLIPNKVQKNYQISLQEHNSIKTIDKKMHSEETSFNNICWCGGILRNSVHPLYVQCELCGTHVVRQKYSSEELQKFYSLSGYWHDHQTLVSGYPPIEVRAKSDFNDRIPYWYELVNKYTSNSGSLLEIGCAHGGFLYYCREHGIKNVVGVEVDEETCKFAQQHFRLPHVCSGLFPNVKLPMTSFDIITGFDVIEHFADPIAGITAISNLLSDNGTFIFQTPCYRGESDVWQQFRPAEHIYLYNESSIRQLFMKCGLEITDILPGYFPDDMFVIGRKSKKGENINFASGYQKGNEDLTKIGDGSNFKYSIEQIITVAKPKKILFLRTDSIGDNVLASTVLKGIKDKFPGADITVLCQNHISELYEHCTYIKNILGIDKNKFLEDEEYKSKIILSIQKEKFDLVINSVFSSEPVNDLLAFTAGAQQTIRIDGNSENSTQKWVNDARELSTFVIKTSEGWTSEINRHKEFLTGLGIEARNITPEIWLSKEDEKFADQFFNENGFNPGKTIVLFTGARYDIRLYNHYGKALSKICRENKFSVVAVGSQDDYKINQDNLDDIHVSTINLSGKTTLKQTAAIIKKCRLAVGAETGNAHIACAVGTPNVIILGGGHFGRFMPYSELTSMVVLPLSCYGCNWQCSFERAYCVKDNDPELVLTAIENALSSKSKKPRIYFNELPSKNSKDIIYKMLSRFLAIDKVEMIEVKKEGILSYSKKLLLLAEEAIQSNHYNTARKLVDNVLYVDPSNVDGLNNLAVIEICEQNHSEAVRLLRQILELDSTNEVALGNSKYLKEKLNSVKNVKELKKSSIHQSEDLKLVTIIVQGRNDGYMGNFEWRLYTNLNKLSQVIHELGLVDEVQIILVDWGSEKPLANVLTLSEEAKNCLEFVHVPKSIATKYNKDSEYSMVHAINTGIKRAEGKYVLFCDGDTYIPVETMKNLVVNLRRGCIGKLDLRKSLFMASRYHIPKTFQTSAPSLPGIDKYIKENHHSFNHDKINLTNFIGTATAYLMLKELWFECRGFDESLIYWGWFDIDLFHRIKSKYDIYDLEDFGMPFYHLEHYSNSKNRDMKAENPRKVNPASMPKYFAPNNDSWGLLDEDINIEKLNRKPITAKKDISSSELNNIIPPEIKDDEFYNEIVDLAKKKEVRTVLEIGSSSGGGSTEAFVKGLRQNPGNPKMFCMEISKNRFAELKKRYETEKFVQCYNVSSVAIKDFPPEDDVKRFYGTTKSSLNLYPIEQVLGWLQQDMNYVSASGVPDDGIQIIREENNLQNFDLVLIDGSEFTGSAELKKVYGAKYILLDDVNAYKNYESYQQLLKDPNYVLIKENWKVRNGYAIFKFKDEEMPVHFFTIVLNGEPFIRYHIDLFKQLPFKWHWHIIEGVAELKNDTAWSVAMGGKVSNEFHRNGLSKDGTTKYLDGLKIEFPDNITIYRKGKGKFWNGKLEMVNAPLKNINEESLLIEIDADELWIFDQILETRKMFLENPAKTAAYFWCHFYVGGNLVTTIKNAYSKTPYYEWIRAWRFNPGNRWTTHEPPSLCMQNGTGQWMDLAKINPFLHNETEAHGLVFHHYAYVLEQQLKFKEIYYGYQNALHVWQKLQNTKNFPVLLKDYFSWVKDLQQVDTLISQGIKPVAVKDDSGQWKFDYVLSRSNIKISVKNNLNKDGKTKEHVPDISKNKIIIDGVIFQIQANRPAGISRVWTSLLTELSKTELADSIVLLDRGGTSPEIQGIKKRNIFRFSGYWEAIADSYYLQDICDEENGLIFISTYYTYPSKTHSIMMLHDFIPELHKWQGLEWKTKKKAIEKARSYLSVSNSTAKDLKRFYPGESLKQVFVISNAVSDNFKVNSDPTIESFKTRYKIIKPYFLVSGTRIFYKNIIQFVKAFSELKNKEEFEILFTGGPSELEADFLPYLKNVKHQVVFLSNEDLSTAYSGAVALVYPSKYEGFGLPLLEAMKSGCPVITCRNSSLTEVAGDAAIYVEEDNIYSMKRALSQISSETLRKNIIKKGLKNAQRFSWTKSADLLFDVLNKKKDELQSMPFGEPEILDDYNELFYMIKSDKILGKATSNLIHLFEIVGEVTEEEFTKEEEVIGKSLLRMIDFNLLSEISTNYRSPYLLYLKGLVHLYNEQEIEAFKSFIEVLKSDFKHWWIAYSAALIALKYNEYDTARQLLEPVLRVKPTFEGAKNKLKEIDRDSCSSNLHSLVKVSAIVSTYNSEKFIDGCLQDLVEQTLFKKGEMEIIVVNTGSQQNEKRIINKFQQKYLNIKYVETKTRETIYAAWNIGIEHSQGKLLTNANTDDRHKSDALEIMAAAFDKNPDADVVYADIFTTVKPNDNWGSNTPKAENNWIQFDKDLILFGCFIGPQPMWKKSLHEKYGNFREELKVVGDYEFWLRISRDAKFIHLNEKLGLYFYSTGSAEHKNKSLTEDENKRIQNEYFIKYVSDLSEVERIKNKLAPVKNAKDGEEYFKNAMKFLELREKGLNIQTAIANFIQQLDQYTGEDINKVSANIQSIISSNNSIVDKSFIENFYLVLGIQHFKNGNIDRSKKLFGNALKINESSSNAYVGLGEVNFLNGDYLAAGEMFTKAVKIDPKNQTALNGLKKIDI